MKSVFNYLVVLGITIVGFSKHGVSQNILMSDGGTNNTCSGSFYDSGGNGGDYDDAENYTITICPSTPGDVIEITFNSFFIEDGFDFLTIYDGPAVDPATMLGVETGSTLDGAVVIATNANASGCLTFVFESDDWIFSSTEAGWNASVNCVTPCIRPVAGGSIQGTSSPAKICPGESVTFDGTSSTAAPGFSIVSYEWDFDDGSTGTGATPSHTFNGVGDYTVNVTVTDDNGCVNTNRIDLQVWTGTTPTFTGTTPDFSVCLNEVACLDGVVNPVNYVGVPDVSVSGTTFLPDGVGQCYSTPVTFTEFSPGQTLNNINDLQSIFVNMEHSWLGDLQITVECPNEQSVILLDYDTDDVDAYLGDPDHGEDVPGIGWDYFWSPNTTNGTLGDNAVGGTSIPSGTYASANPLNALVGCPLNGDWSIEICDDQGADDGYIFGWSIYFDPSLYPNPVDYTPVYAANCTGSSWSGSGITTTSGDCNNICVNTTTSGNFDYVYSVNDDFGCTYDTTITVTVLPATDPTCPNCLITWFSSSISACDLATGNYEASGTIDFVDPPSSGDLVISVDNGTTVYSTTISFPFPATDGTPNNGDDIAWSIPNIPADGANSTISAVFTDNTACEYSDTYTAPTCPCAIGMSVSQGFCDAITNSFQLTGDLTLPGGPLTGTINIVVDNGTSTYDTIINPPFVDGQTWSITGIPADGANYSVTAFYSVDPTCESVLNMTAPADCACSANIGTFTTTMTGDGENDYVLCYGDVVTFTSDNNWTPPGEASNPPITDYDPAAGYRPGIGWFIYSCPPQITEPDDLFDAVTGAPLDPCYEGFIGFGETMSDENFLGSPSYNGSWTNNTMYYVPITFYDTVQGYYSFVNTTISCYDLGTPIAVQYLPEITTTQSEDCQTGTVSVTVNGGLPALDVNENFTGSNLLPATASFFVSSAADGDDIIIQGLQDGDMYSFDIEDANGCPIQITGGPFVGLPVADAGDDDQICALTYTLSGSTPMGTGTWTGPGGVVFGNANSPTSTVTVPSAGSYTFTWTDNNGGGCTDSDDVTVQFSDVQYTQVVNQSTCGNSDGSISLSANSGIPTYSYSIDNGVTTQASGAFAFLPASTYNIVVEDALGCQATGSITISDLGGPTIDAINGADINCNAGCDGSISISATGATEFSINNGTTFQALNTFTGLCANDYDIVIQDNVGCQAFGSITLTQPDLLAHSTTQVDLLCANDCDGEIAISATGGTAPYQYSVDNGTSNQATGSFINLCYGTYDILVTDAHSCTSTTQVALTEPTQLTSTVGTTDATCFGQCNGTMNSIPAGGTGPGTYNYAWSPAVAGNVPFVTNLCAGSYNLTITDGNGCTLDITGIVVGAPAPVTIDNVTTTDETCGGDCDGTVDITATGATEFSIDGINYGASSTFTNLCAGTYTVYAQDVNGCSSSDQAIVVGPSPVDVLASGTSTICIGQTAPLTSVASGGVGNYSYAWDNGTTTQNTNVTPANTQSYCVVATDGNGCQSPPSCVTIALNPPLSVIALSDQSICEGDFANITAIGSGGNGGPYTYTWDQGVGSGGTQSVGPAFTTTYTVTVSDGCTTPSATDDVTITVNTIPNISFSADNFDGCYPVNVNFTETNVPAGSQCLWSFGDGGATTNCSNVNYSFENPGCWDVTLQITTPEGCQSSSTIADYICVYDYPNPDFVFDPQPTTILEPTITFTNLTTGASDYTWTFDTGGSAALSNSVNPVYSFGDVGSFEVCLDAVSFEGCPSQVCDTVVILEEFVVYVPNAFTPDGDGVNNEFMPIISGVIPDSYEFLVFNRWGELIFQSQVVGVGWDGTYKGLMSQEDVYVWKLKVDDQLGKTHDYIGHVTLLK